MGLQDSESAVILKTDWYSNSIDISAYYENKLVILIAWCYI